MRLTAKERILLHLLESTQPADDVEVSLASAQEGVARGAGIEMRHLAQFVRPLIQEGLVRERRAHVTGIRQRRKVYALTSAGRTSAVRLREKVTARVVRLRDGDSVREGSLDEVLQRTGGRTGSPRSAREVAQTGAVDFTEPRLDPPAGFVEHIWDAPRTRAFVGRQKELAEILRERGSPRVVVVRGVAGIGKSALGAIACERLRGRKNLFWHGVRPWETGPTILASLGRFLEALDRPGLNAILKRGECASAAEVLRQDLPDTNAFLVFDDVHEAPAETLSVFRMLKDSVAAAPDVKVLILTRRALPFYDVRAVAIEGNVQEIELGALRPEEAAALLSEGGNLAALAGLGRRLAGHPLSIELVRAHFPDMPRGIQDTRRFMEEAVYRDLPDAERITMKGASLYHVPVPLSALLSIPGTSYEALLALQERSLIRSVGLERYEVHDTIRDFFGSILTAEERQRFGPAAIAQLRDQAAQALASGDVVASIACLSNALRIAESAEERRALWESLGDANSRIGDLLALSTAYREALGLTNDPALAARLHRKLAFALQESGYMTAAQKEIEAGLTALAGLEDLELGWLNLARARVAKEDFAWDRTESYAESARKTFERFNNLTGQAHAFLEAGMAAVWTGNASEDGVSLAEGRFREALELAEAVRDPVLEAQVHLAMATAIGYGSGDFEEGMKHFRAVESCPAAMADPNVGPSLHYWRAWFVLRIKRDLSAAKRDLAEARRMSLKVHNAGALGTVTFLSAVIAGEMGQYGAAARLDEDAGSALARTGLGASATDAYFSAAGFYLAAGDWGGYRRVSSVLRSPQLAPYTRNQLEKPAILGAFESLLQGNPERFEKSFATMLHAAEASPAHPLYRNATLWWDHFYYSVGLRALGREQEAEDHRRRALEMARSAHNAQGMNYVESDYGERISRTLRRRMKSA